MLQPGRQYSAGSSYRYGFNGKEKDKDIAADDYDFGARIYDGRIGRWLSTDPLATKYPGETPYMFSGANPIIYSDPDGKDRILMVTIINQDGSMTRIQQVDYSKFNYTKENVYDGGVKYYRSSEVIDLIIDNRSGTETTIEQAMNNPEASNIKIQRSIIDEESISGFTYYAHKIFGSISSDMHLKSKVGIFTYGKGYNTGWQQMNETAAEGSESIDLESMLDVLGSIGPSNSPSELYNEIVQKWLKYTGKDMKEVLNAINIMVKAIDGSTEAVLNGMEAVESIERLNDNGAVGLDPGKSDEEVVAHCPWCKTNYRDSLNNWVPTKKPAKDTMTETQYTPPSKNKLKEKKN